MDRWSGKLAVVTGAAYGIGAAIAVELAKQGLIVIGLSRCRRKVEELSDKLPTGTTGKIIARKFDISQEEEIITAFQWINEEYGGVDILVNNSIVLKPALLTAEGNEQAIRDYIDINYMGHLFCSREAVQSMMRRNFDGHIVNINTILNHRVPHYTGMREAIRSSTECLRQELIFLRTKIKVTCISPGMVANELNYSQDKSKVPLLNVDDIVQAVVYVLGTPINVQVHELVIKPIGELF